MKNDALFPRIYYDFLITFSNLQLHSISIKQFLFLLSVAGCSKDRSDSGLKDQQQWSIAKCGLIFADSVKNLRNDFFEKSASDHLVWDKDDQSAMDFVASCANIRAHIFGIPQKTRFDIKCK